MSTAGYHFPIRTIADIEAYERVPLEQRVRSWDVNDWIRHGLARIMHQGDGVDHGGRWRAASFRPA